MPRRTILVQRGIGYSHPESVGGLLRRRKAKPKTERPRHEEADGREQEDFKRSSPEGVEKQSERHPGKPFEGPGF
ncbi:MAG: hypothetical protein IN808_06040 [Rubrobacter sp.]|nr:hypothetical protein [Rubrobacter sp.]